MAGVALAHTCTVTYYSVRYYSTVHILRTIMEREFHLAPTGNVAYVCMYPRMGTTS